MALKKLYVPFRDGNHLYRVLSKPTKSNHYQCEFEAEGTDYSPRWFRNCGMFGYRWRDDKIIYKENFVFHAKLALNYMFTYKYDVVVGLIDAYTFKQFYALNKQATQILNKMTNGEIEADFTFCSESVYKTSLVIANKVPVYKVVSIDELDRQEILYTSYTEISARLMEKYFRQIKFNNERVVLLVE